MTPITQLLAAMRAVGGGRGGAVAERRRRHHGGRLRRLHHRDADAGRADQAPVRRDRRRSRAAWPRWSAASTLVERQPGRAGRQPRPRAARAARSSCATSTLRYRDDAGAGAGRRQPARCARARRWRWSARRARARPRWSTCCRAFSSRPAAEVLLDGVPLREWRIDALRRQFALVSQDVVLFNDTRGGQRGARRRGRRATACARALRGAHLLDFALALPQGMRHRASATTAASSPAASASAWRSRARSTRTRRC